MIQKLRIICLTIMLGAIGLAGWCQSSHTQVQGEWSFVLDPVKVGEKQQWFLPDFNFKTWDKTTVPHCFTTDPRYHYYTGTAWYKKRMGTVTVPPGYRAFLRFEAVFYKTKGWLNGRPLGEHEGGYTPFEWDVTDALTGDNILSLQVNNAWDTTTIPGAKTWAGVDNTHNAQLFPWINYGGITREVYLIVRPAAYIENIKIDARPDLAKNTATLQVAAYIQNKSSQALTPDAVQLALYRGEQKISLKTKQTGQPIAAGASGVILFNGVIAARDVQRWHIDNPVLYRAQLTAGRDTLSRAFGIRSVEISGTKLLLNGEPIHLGGCNRPLDIPGYGSMDPQQALEHDLVLIKSAGMELSRISHYPVSTRLLDWADAHGLLIIAEAGNWQMTPKQMADPAMRKKFQSQMQEMIARDWNHPSVIAWSVGNEYHSHTDEGKAWTKDMYAFTKTLDPTRLVTFASMFVFRDQILKPEDEASQYVDFVSANIYGNHRKLLDHIHALYPDKPVYISEFGLRADQVKNEQERVEHLRKAMADFRACDYLIGASVWTFNDYASSFPGTNANGYRPWGLVSPERELRGMYHAWKEEFSPATIATGQQGDKLVITVTARKDFPSYTLYAYTLRAGGQSFAIDRLRPGESKAFTLTLQPGQTNPAIELVKPGGFVVLKK